MIAFRTRLHASLLVFSALFLLASDTRAGCDLEATTTAPSGDELPAGKAIDWRISYRNIGDAPCKANSVRLNRISARGGASVTIGGSGGRQRLDKLKPGRSQTLSFNEAKPPSSGEYIYKFKFASPHNDDNNRNHLSKRRVKFAGSAEADAKVKARTRAAASAKADAKAKEEAEARSSAEAEAKAKEDAQAKADARSKADAEAKANAEAEAKAKAETEAKAKAATEAQAEAATRERAAAEARAKAAAEERATAEADAKAKAEADAKAEARARAEADARAASAKEKAEARAKAEAEAKAKAETEAKAATREKAAAEAKEEEQVERQRLTGEEQKRAREARQAELAKKKEKQTKKRERPAKEQARAEAEKETSESDTSDTTDTSDANGTTDTAEAASGPCELTASWAAPLGEALPQGETVEWQIAFTNTGAEACNQSTTHLARFTGTALTGSPLKVGGSGGNKTLPSLAGGASTTLTYRENVTPQGGTYTYQLKYFPGINDGDLDNHQLQRTVAYSDAPPLAVGQCDLRATLMQPTAKKLTGGTDHTWEIFFRNDGNAGCNGNQVYLTRSRQDPFVAPAVVGGNGNLVTLPALGGGSDVLIQIEENDAPSSGAWTYQLAFGTPHSDANNQNHILVRMLTYKGSGGGNVGPLNVATGNLTVEVGSSAFGVDDVSVCLFSDIDRSNQIGVTQQTDANGQTTFFGVPVGTVYFRGLKDRVVNGATERIGRESDFDMGDGEQTLGMGLFATVLQGICPAAPPPEPAPEPDPVVNEPELWPTPPDVSFPALVMPLGTRVCQTVQFALAPQRDTSKTIGLFVNKNSPLIDGGVDVGWVDPTRLAQGAANDLAGPIEVLRAANGQVTHPDGQNMTPFQICAEDWAGARVGTYTTVYSVADRSGDTYAPQAFFKQGTFSIQVVAPAAPQPDDGPTPVDTTTWDAIEPAFKAISCINCHTAAAGNFANLSSQHNGANAPVRTPGACTGCHADDLLPDLAQVSHAIPWQAPPASMDLRIGDNDPLLCQMARDPGTLASDTTDHLKGDPLILWAVLGGLRPNGTAAVPAFSSLADWNSAVEAWVLAGTPCPQ